MKAASASLISFLDSTTVGILRHLITVTPRSGSVVRWTDHHESITYSGNTYQAGGDGTTYPVVVVGGGEQVTGLDVTTLRLTLFCGDGSALFNGTYLPRAALEGTLDGAWVKVERVFGAADLDLTLGTLHVFEGPIGSVDPSDTSVEVEVESGLAQLRLSLPRIVFQAGCTNRLYDTQCGLNRATFTVTGLVLAGATTTVVPTSRSEAAGTTNSLGYYALGVITFTSGTCNGESRGIRSYTSPASIGTFVMDRPLPAVPAENDAFSVYPGCPKTLAACENNTASAGPQFNNIVHFRGFPFVPKYETGQTWE